MRKLRTNSRMCRSLAPSAALRPLDEVTLALTVKLKRNGTDYGNRIRNRTSDRSSIAQREVGGFSNRKDFDEKEIRASHRRRGGIADPFLGFPEMELRPVAPVDGQCAGRWPHRAGARQSGRLCEERERQ